MKQTSPWIDGRAAAAFPALDRDIEVDVAIVGGGITGLTTAKLLSEQGRKVAVLEARAPGGGATGHSTGNLYVPLSNGLRAVKAKWGVDALRTVVGSRAAALDLIENTVRVAHIECAFARCPWHYYTLPEGKDSNSEIEQEYQALRDAGLDPRLVGDLPLPFPVERAIRLENQAQFDPFAYADGLAARLRASGCEVYARSPVTAIDAGGGTLRTAGGTVRCAQMVLATHTPKGVHAVQMEMGSAIELGLACRLKDGSSYPSGIYWGIGKPATHSLRSAESNGRKYLIVISDSYATGHDADMRRHAEELERFARARFAVEAVDFAWAAEHFRSADALPFIGTSHVHRNLYFATGFFTDGLVYGTLAAMMLSDAIQGRPNPWAATYGATRIDPVKAAKGTARETLHVVKHLATDYLTDKHAQALSAIKAGEGGLVETDDGKIAVYRDSQGSLTALSAKCPHLGCMVHWNNAQKTWDCPCHGSRFDTNGAVLEGPALRPLRHATAGR